MLTSSSVVGRDAPDAARRLAGLEYEHAVSGPERVGRARHRLDGEAAAPHTRELVAREELDVRIAVVQPEREGRTRVRIPELDSGDAARVALEIRVGVVELGRSDQ